MTTRTKNKVETAWVTQISLLPIYLTCVYTKINKKGSKRKESRV